MKRCAMCGKIFGTKGVSSKFKNSVTGNEICDLCVLFIFDKIIRPNNSEKTEFTVKDINNIFHAYNNLDTWFRWTEQLLEDKNEKN